MSCDPDPVHAKPAGNQTWDWQEKAGKLVWRFKRLPAGAEATLKVCWVGGIPGLKSTRAFGLGLPDWSWELSAGGRLTGQGMVVPGNLRMCEGSGQRWEQLLAGLVSSRAAADVRAVAATGQTVT